MKYYLKPVVEFLKKEDGPTAVECAMMFGLVIVVCVLAIQTSRQPYPSAMEPKIVDMSNSSR